METIKQKKGSVPLSISIYDLDYCLASVGVTFESLLSHEQDAILYYLGIDMQVPLEVFECLHRTKFKPGNEPHYGTLITGVERVDAQWFWSGKASLENRINRHTNSGFSTELRIMSATSNFTADICEHVQQKRDTHK